jgi:Transposase DDE domain
MPHYTATAPLVQRRAADRLQRHLPLTDHGPKCTAHTLLALLLWAAARATSLAAACAALAKAPTGQAARAALRADLPDAEPLRRRLSRALADGLPRCLRGAAVPLAVDLTLIPYYGRPQADEAEVYRGKAKAGTKRFHAYATAYVIRKGRRWTVALRPVGHADPWNEVVRDLLRQARKAGVRVRYLLLDRGFYSVAVIRHLQAARVPFILPAIRRGRKPDDPRGPSGTWAAAAQAAGGWAEYTLREKGGRSATVRLYACRGRRRRRGRRRGKAEVWLYAVWGLRPQSVGWVRAAYRRRFGIESSYRQLNQARARTSSRDPLLRLLYAGVALVLRNVWVWLHWEVLAGRRRGYRAVGLGRLPLRQLLQWVAGLAERLLGRRLWVPCERPWPDSG